MRLPWRPQYCLWGIVLSLSVKGYLSEQRSTVCTKTNGSVLKVSVLGTGNSGLHVSASYTKDFSIVSFQNAGDTPCFPISVTLPDGWEGSGWGLDDQSCCFGLMVWRTHLMWNSCFLWKNTKILMAKRVFLLFSSFCRSHPRELILS